MGGGAGEMKPFTLHTRGWPLCVKAPLGFIMVKTPFSECTFGGESRSHWFGGVWEWGVNQD